MKKIVSGLVFLLSLTCGQKKVVKRDQDQMLLMGHCLKEVEGGRSCVDYQNLSSSEFESTNETCSASSDNGAFIEGSLCPDGGKIGGCDLPVVNDVEVTVWTYSSGEDAIDQEIVDIAKESCETEVVKEKKGTWRAP